MTFGIKGVEAGLRVEINQHRVVRHGHFVDEIKAVLEVEGFRVKLGRIPFFSLVSSQDLELGAFAHDHGLAVPVDKVDAPGRGNRVARPS